VDFKRLGTILTAVGTALTVAAVAWWFTFYSSVMRELALAPGAPPGGHSVLDAVTCLYSSQDLCGFITGLARLAGRTPYEPMLFWVGVASLAAGIIVRLSARPTAGRA
jgi:hypothetical protein